MKFAPGFNPFSLPRPPSNNPFGGYGGMGQQFGGGGGPLAPLGSAITQQLSEKQQPEVQEFMGEVTDMANERFEIDLGAVGQRPMFSQVARPAVQMYEKGGAAFPDVTGPGGGPPDGKVTQADVLKLRGVELKEDGGTVEMQKGGTIFEGVTGVKRERLKDLSPEMQALVRQKYLDFLLRNRVSSRETQREIDQLNRDMSPFNLGPNEFLLRQKQMLERQLKDYTPTQTPAEALAERDRERNLQKFNEQMRLMDLQDLNRQTTSELERARQLQRDVDQTSNLARNLRDKMDAVTTRMGVQGFQEGGMAMPMPMPEQPPMPAGEQLDPNIVQQALTQAAGGIGDLDQAQNYEQVMNTMRGDQATVEQRRQELAGVVGPQDAGQTPESVLTLVQPVMMLANVDQGIGELAQQEMTQPMEGPMAEGIMSTVPEPPMMEAGGNAPVNFNQGGEVRPIQNFALGGDAKTSPFGNLPGRGGELTREAFDLRRGLLSDPADLKRQRDLSQAQALFDIAQTAVTFAAPMPGERPGMSPAERLALATSTTKLPEKIGASAQALMDAEKAQKQQDKAVMLSAIESGEKELAAERQRAFTSAEAQAQRDFELLKLDKQLDFNKFENESNRAHEIRLVNERSKIQFGLAQYARDTSERGLVIKGQLNERLARLNAELQATQATVAFERTLELQGVKTLDQIKIIGFQTDQNKELAKYNNTLSQDSMLKQQKFQAAQNALDRAQKDQIQLNDQNFKKLMQEELNKFNMSENDKNRALNEAQFQVTAAFKERGLDLQEGTLSIQAIAQAFDEQYKTEKLALERLALEATELGSKAKTAQITYLTNAERLEKYKNNTLGDETAKFNQALLEYTQPSYTWNGTTYTKNPKPDLAPEIKNALIAREEAGFSIPNIPGLKTETEPGAEKFDSSDFKQGLIKDGAVNFNSPNWDRIPNSVISSEIAYERATGPAEIGTRVGRAITEFGRELGLSKGPTASMSELTTAERDILNLKEEILTTVFNMQNDRVLKAQQDAIRALAEPFTPGNFKFDESAAATLSGLKKQLGRAFAFYASHDPDYEPEALNKYDEKIVQKYRSRAANIRSVLKDVITLERAYLDYFDTLRGSNIKQRLQKGDEDVSRYFGGGKNLDETKNIIQQLIKE
jgi:ribonucleotide monophosphatase NagD (HAD superfamily)